MLVKLLSDTRPLTTPTIVIAPPLEALLPTKEEEPMFTTAQLDAYTAPPFLATLELKTDEPKVAVTPFPDKKIAPSPALAAFERKSVAFTARETELLIPSVEMYIADPALPILASNIELLLRILEMQGFVNVMKINPPPSPCTAELFLKEHSEKRILLTNVVDVEVVELIEIAPPAVVARLLVKILCEQFNWKIFASCELIIPP